jgi:GNAT superfamily N-acetyltransferase
MEIRKAKKEELDSIYSIYLELQDSEDSNFSKISKDILKFRKRKSNFPKISKRQLLKSIKDKKKRFIIALSESEILGYAFGEIESSGDKKSKSKKKKKKSKGDEPFNTPKTGWINALVVKKGNRGKGIGTKLHNNLKAWFKSKNCKYIELMATSSNKAVKLYNKLGYRNVYLKMNKKIIP